MVRALKTIKAAPHAEQLTSTPALAPQAPQGNSNTNRSGQDANVRSAKNNIDELMKKLGNLKLLAQSQAPQGGANENCRPHRLCYKTSKKDICPRIVTRGPTPPR
jgi:hypothetical protein